ncbi:hypothetical protein [Pseudomonas fluorescens]|uniref:hypothetical protein n=1 Tax=Pseudomonas fluorescens TaxID=294 RepID=UPI00123FF860|nr:hypothetical protein [Pseudomonas fluorescens]
MTGSIVGINKTTLELRRDLKVLALHFDKNRIAPGRLVQQIAGVDGLVLMKLLGKLYVDAGRLLTSRE